MRLESGEYEVMHTVLRNWCNTYVEGCERDPRRCPARESLVSLAARDYGFPSRNVNESLATVLVLLERTHGAKAAYHVVRQTTMPHAVDCAQVCPNGWGSSEVVFQGVSESATQASVNAMKVERSKKAMLEESPKCLHQLSGEAENAARRIESPEQACACLLQEYSGRKVVSEGIAPSRPDWQVVPSQSEKRDDGHSVRSRARGKRCDGPLAQDGGTTGCKVVRRGMAELEPRWATKACLDCTGERDEVIVGAATGVEFSQSLRNHARDDQRQRDVFTAFVDVPWDTNGLAGELVTRRG